MDHIEDPKRVKYSTIKLKFYASFCWENVQEKIINNGKYKIMIWDILVAKMKDKFLPTDFMISLFRKIQNL